MERNGLILVACLLVFAFGVVVGREFPAHHYERFGESAFLYDSTTGRMCNPYKSVAKDSMGLQTVPPQKSDGAILWSEKSEPKDYLPPCEK
jgi:hypothetical protein